MPSITKFLSGNSRHIGYNTYFQGTEKESVAEYSSRNMQEKKESYEIEKRQPNIKLVQGVQNEGFSMSPVPEYTFRDIGVVRNHPLSVFRNGHKARRVRDVRRVNSPRELAILRRRGLLDPTPKFGKIYERPETRRVRETFCSSFLSLSFSVLENARRVTRAPGVCLVSLLLSLSFFPSLCLSISPCTKFYWQHPASSS